MSAASSSSSRNAIRRLLKELETWNNVESAGEEGIERLGPVSEDQLLNWEAVINGRGVGHGYDHGRWLLRITVPPTYPLQPPQIAFATPIVHPNVHLQTGEICLDLLKDAWSPVYSVLECVRAIRVLLATPGLESPFNVDVAALLQKGDVLGARGLVELWVDEKRYEGK
ncbi:putative ubiquitin protein [Canariomyces notabilis]|uniref:Ubiquitin protein n=1 Tax=Canariomyces notabilis TaxID=2074819 RepID=A0AAN6TCR8_9PEZI|nr:putative ubiquitin protein [Canariomyces arenarius]